MIIVKMILYPSCLLSQLTIIIIMMIANANEDTKAMIDLGTWFLENILSVTLTWKKMFCQPPASDSNSEPESQSVVWYPIGGTPRHRYDVQSYRPCQHERGPKLLFGTNF